VVLDSSAVVSDLLREPGHEEIRRLMDSAVQLRIGAPTLVESIVVMSNRTGESGAKRVWKLIDDLNIVVVPFTVELVKMADLAFHRYGKGRHPAALNYGDCMSYAVAKVAGEPMLFTGDDFGQTDIRIAR
jgi:ribonuclease VapC